MENLRISRYATIGLRKPWLESFLERGVEWFEDNTLGSSGREAMNRYLMDAGLIDREKKPTPLFDVLTKFVYEDPKTAWQVVWVNLCINSDLFRWYVQEVPWDEVWTRDELVAMLEEKGIARRTAQNAVYSLTNTFENSPLGEWFGKKVGKKTYHKCGTNDVTIWALGYSLYRLKELTGWKGTSVREIFRLRDAGPYVWFGTSRYSFVRKLHSLKDRKLISADVVADLDNVHFYEDVSPVDVLKAFFREKARDRSLRRTFLRP